MSVADGLCTTDAEREALVELRRACGDPDSGPMERHSIRVFLMAEEAARLQDRAIDREVLLVAAILHDAGLYATGDLKASYVIDGRLQAEELGRRHGWSPERVTRCADAVEYHHELRQQWERGVEVELLRRADLAELTGDRVRSLKLDRAWLRDLEARVSHRGVLKYIAGRVVGQARMRPASLPKIFRP